MVALRAQGKALRAIAAAVQAKGDQPREPNGTFPPRYRPRAFWSAFTCPIRSPDAIPLGLGKGGGDRQKQF